MNQELKQRVRSSSVRVVIVGSFGVLVLLVVLFQALYFPSRFAASATEGLARKATAIARLLAYSSASMVDLGDANVRDAFAGAAEDEDVRYIVILAEGKIFGGINEERLPPREQLAGQGERIIRRDGELVAIVPIEAVTVSKAEMVVGVSTDTIRSEIRANRTTTWVMAALIALVGLAIALFAGSYVNRKIEAMREIARRVATTALQIQSASRQITANARQQEQGAAEQASAVEETTRTLASLLESGRQVTETAQGVLRNAERTLENNRVISERIKTLSEQTQRISDILEVIKDIANKSELLALNAALEGTKAGEAGRGFSLVANQMQRLAENVMESVQSIRRLTADINEATHASVLATEEGTAVATDTNRAAHQISLVVQQQQSGTEQVTQAMGDVGRVAQQIAAGSKDVAGAIEDILSLSVQFEELVTQFSDDGEPRKRA